MVESVRATAASDVEILCYVTHDDHSYDYQSWPIRFINGPRLVMSDLWNALLPHANGDIFMQCADDVLFRTPRWDRYVEEAFAWQPDRILLVHGHDLHPNGENFGTLPFVSRAWVEAIGYFTGPGFAVDFSDTWPNDVANLIGRRRYLPLVFEHCHWLWGKSEMDETYQEMQDLRLKEGLAITSSYAERLPERQADAEKLRKVMR